MGNKFALGKKAFGFCDVCGFRFPLVDLREQVVKDRMVNIKACPQDWSPDHPQLKIGLYPFSDPQALRNPRPDNGQSPSRLVLIPIYNGVTSSFTVSPVTVTTS